MLAPLRLNLHCTALHCAQPIDHTERCAEGYSGRLCHRCVPGYGRSGQNGCAKCPDRGINMLLISGGVVAAFFVMGFLIYTTRKSAKDDKDLMMMMIKIFMSCVASAVGDTLACTTC